MPTPGDTICGEISLDRLAPASLGAEVFQPVFAARDPSRDESLWLTVIDGGFTPTSVDLSKFMAGANALVGVRHPALVRVVLVDREEDYCVVGYEQLPGAEPLSDLIVQGGSRKLLARAAIEVARGLAYLHRRELLHGALTPGTVLLWEGVPVLWEYGLSALCVPDCFGPRARSLGGDVVAPEVPQGTPLTPAVDVYAWGAVMASIASGELGAEAVAAVEEDDVDVGRHAALLDVVKQSLAPDPASRPRDGVHLLELLQRALASVDPAVEQAAATAESAPAGDDGLQDLARRYLEEMSAIERSGETRVKRPPSAPKPAASPAGGQAGALGKLKLAKVPASEVGKPQSRSKAKSAPKPVVPKPPAASKPAVPKPPAPKPPAPPKPSVSRPWLSGSPPRDREPTPPPTTTPPPVRARVASPVPRGEPTDIGPRLGSPAPSESSERLRRPVAQSRPSSDPIPAAPEIEPEPESSSEDSADWTGRYKLPSGTYAAVRDAPKPAGDGTVRGPTPGGSGSDAGALSLDASPASSSGNWGAPTTSSGASSWLRPAAPKAADGGVGDLFELNRWLRELPHGISKRWVLLRGRPPAGPSADESIPGGVPPLQTGAPEAIEDDVTPTEGIRKPDAPEPGDVVRGLQSAEEAASLPPSERETPPDDMEVVERPDSAAARPSSSEIELPPLPEARLPSGELPPADPSLTQGKRQQPFRAPRLPGPHGPPAVVMALVVMILGGTMALAATLSASQARGGFARLFDSGEAKPASEDAAPGQTPRTEGDTAPAVAEGPCPEGMVLISDKDQRYCIDRAEYPGIDRPPAIDVDLEHAEKACTVRGADLCTEVQWRRACRGSSDWRYPYGPTREAGRCRVGDGSAAPGPTGADPHCVSPEGVVDLVGNVAEWTKEGFVMGGSVKSKKSTGCASRQRAKPSAKRPTLGFRCCMALPGPEADAAEADAP
ncbi:MAG: SUMF1/EgtB/PvdO family nonheme iron enzyme [Myxococcota bacterium]